MVVPIKTVVEPPESASWQALPPQHTPCAAQSESLTGKLLWRHAYPTSYEDPYGYNNGPRCAPLLTKDRCYTFGAEGVLLCLDLKTGKPIWRRDTHKDFKVIPNFFGVGSTPVLENGLLITMVGAQPNSGMVAFDAKTGKVDASSGAGVALYSFAGAQRASAGEARAAQQLVDQAKKEGKLAPSATVNEENLRKIGVNGDKARDLADAQEASKAQIARLDDETLLRGFGNNGGEEFLSYLMTSESLVITGGDAWKQWNQKIIARLSKVQNPDGSWNGHHCISSPVF